MIGGLRKTSVYLLAGVSAVGILASAGTAAKAADTAQLEAQMRAMQAQMKELQRQVQEAKSTSAHSGGNDLDLKVKWKGAPQLSSGDGKFKFKVRGRIMADYDSIDQDETVTGKDDISGVELRRARIGVEGVIFYDWKYKAEVDFAGDEVSVKDMYLAYDFGPGSILLGQFKVANSLEEMTSSRFITFMERASFVEAFIVERQIGAGIHAGGDHWSLQTGYYGAPTGAQGDFSSDTTSAAVRGTIAPIDTDTTIVHLGASYRHRDAGTERGGASDIFRYRARAADLHLADRFINTGHVAEQDDMFVLEGAAVYKRFSLQGE